MRCFQHDQIVREKYEVKRVAFGVVLLSDILSRKLNGEEIAEEDEELIKHWDVRKELMKLDKKLLIKAFEAFFNKAYSTTN